MMRCFVERIYLKYFQCFGHGETFSTRQWNILAGSSKEGRSPKERIGQDRAEDKGRELETQAERFEDVKVMSTKQSPEQ